MTANKDLYLTQKALSEWLEDINHADTEVLRKEDNEKRERLAELREIAGIPYDEQVKFMARDVADNTPEHAMFLAEHGDELCALRLIPINPALPRLRMRGWTVKEVQKWFFEQKIDADMYRAEYVPHAEQQDWATIFVVNDRGVFGEIIRGRHSQLTQGFYDGEDRPFTFSYDYSTWRMEPVNNEALGRMKEIIGYLKLSAEQQNVVQERLGGTFTHGYLKGYFETTEGPEFGLWFVDYAPSMGELIGDIAPPIATSGAIVKGQVGCSGRASGIVQIVETGDNAKDFKQGSVLVSEMTTPDLVPIMQKACAIVTDNGGILSHAAIVARELKKPCIVGTGNATKVLKNGDKVVVNAVTGQVVVE